MVHKSTRSEYVARRVCVGALRNLRVPGVKVAFDARPLSDLHGLGRYSRCLLSALRATASEGDSIEETQRPSAFARSRSADLYHAPWMGGALLHTRCPSIITLHSLAPLKRRSEHLRTGMRARLRPLAVQRAERVIVPSQTLARDAVAHLGVQEERIAVIPPAADPLMRPRDASQVAAVRARYGLPPQFLLWVGGLQHPDPGRHLAELAAASRELPLVLVGATRPWAHELPGVILTGRVGDEDLAAIYTAAHALVLPCEDEGFSLAAVEALACGTPVAAYDAPALRELFAERAELVERGDMAALVRAAEGARRPAPPAPAWSWEDAAEATWRLYAAAVESARSEPAVRRRRPAAAPALEAIEGLEAQ